MSRSPFVDVFGSLHDFCGLNNVEPPEVRLVFKDRVHRGKFKWAVKRELNIETRELWDLEDRHTARMMDIPVKFHLQADGDPLAEIMRLLEENRKLRATIASATKILTP